MLFSFVLFVVMVIVLSRIMCVVWFDVFALYMLLFLLVQYVVCVSMLDVVRCLMCVRCIMSCSQYDNMLTCMISSAYVSYAFVLICRNACRMCMCIIRDACLIW